MSMGMDTYTATNAIWYACWWVCYLAEYTLHWAKEITAKWVEKSRDNLEQMIIHAQGPVPLDCKQYVYSFPFYTLNFPSLDMISILQLREILLSISAGKWILGPVCVFSYL